MAQYLYGAAVQGIQPFIFQTSSLRDIIGRSEIVEQICTDLFIRVLGKGTGYRAHDDDRFLVHAAGNVKYLFDSEEACREVVLRFPKAVMEAAPGITVSQAVVPYTGDFGKDVDELERRLRIQRNRPARSNQPGLLGVRRNARTGQPALALPDFPDEGSLKASENYRAMALCEKAFGTEVGSARFPFDVDSITGKNNWIAVIHADGNGLGQIIRRTGHDKDALRRFSADLDRQTAEAAREAFKQVWESFGLSELLRLPIRPVVLSGDDLTVICRADLALEYVTAFIRSFEQATGLTACAGIAFVKSSFPFAFAYELAENLCAAAKTDAKSGEAVRRDGQMPPSCLLYHKVQDSTVEDFRDIVRRELSPAPGYSLFFGPYYLKPRTDRWTVDKLLEETKKLEKRNGNIAKTALRRWLSLISVDVEQAEQQIRRAISVSQGLERDLNAWTIPSSRGTVPVYDMLSLNTMMNQITR